MHISPTKNSFSTYFHLRLFSSFSPTKNISPYYIPTSGWTNELCSIEKTHKKAFINNLIGLIYWLELQIKITLYGTK